MANAPEKFQHYQALGGEGVKCPGATILLILLHRKMVVPVTVIKPRVLQRKRKFTRESVFMTSLEHRFKYMGNVFCGNGI